jgi:Apea-like HEPN
MTLENKLAVFRVQFNYLGRIFTKMRGDIAAWNDLFEAATEFRFKSSDGEILVTIDWMDAKEYIVKSHSQIDLDKIKTKEDYDAMLSSFEEYRRLKSIGAIKDNFEIKFSIYNSSDEYSNFGYVTNILHQLFLAMNLSIPGSCDFYSAIIRPVVAENDTYEKEIRLRLSGSIIASSTKLIDEMKWPEIHEIPVKIVLQWIEKIGFSKSSFAHSNTERAIFGLLYSCMHEEIEPTALIWLTQALEALFDTPQLGIANTLKERVFLVLEKPNENLKKINKAINAFYDYRSRYVHGEIALPNPMSIRLLDKTLDDFEEELIQHMDFAMILIVASLQKLIIKDSNGFNFSETLSMKAFA